MDGTPIAREEEADGLEVEEVASAVVYTQKKKKLIQVFSAEQASSPIQAAEFVHDLY